MEAPDSRTYVPENSTGKGTNSPTLSTSFYHYAPAIYAENIREQRIKYESSFENFENLEKSREAVKEKK